MRTLLCLVIALAYATSARACEPEDVFCEEPALEPAPEDDWSSAFIGLAAYDEAEERAKLKKKRKKAPAASTAHKRPMPTSPQP